MAAVVKTLTVNGGEWLSSCPICVMYGERSSSVC